MLYDDRDQMYPESNISSSKQVKRHFTDKYITLPSKERINNIEIVNLLLEKWRHIFLVID